MGTGKVNFYDPLSRVSVIKIEKFLDGETEKKTRPFS